MRYPRQLFTSARQLHRQTDNYFIYTDGEYDVQEYQGKHEKVYTRPPEPPTISGLALYLGFNSRQEFEDYCSKGRYAAALQRAKLRIEAAYEKRLHQQSPTGAIFILKSLGWSEKSQNAAESASPGKLELMIVESGPLPASDEKQVIM